MAGVNEVIGVYLMAKKLNVPVCPNFREKQFLVILKKKIKTRKKITILGMSTCWWCGVVRNGATFANVWLRGFVWHHRNEVFYFSPFFRWGQFYFDRNSFEFLKNCWRKPKPSSKSRLDNLKNTKLRALISVKVFFISGFQLFRSELRNGIRILQELEFLLESCLSPVLDFWKIKLEKSSLTNWIFSLLPNWCLQTKQAAKIKFEIHRLKIQSVELDFSNLIFQKSSTDQQGIWTQLFDT